MRAGCFLIMFTRPLPMTEEQKVPLNCIDSTSAPEHGEQAMGHLPFREVACTEVIMPSLFRPPVPIDY